MAKEPQPSCDVALKLSPESYRHIALGFAQKDAVFALT